VFSGLSAVILACEVMVNTQKLKLGNLEFLPLAGGG